MKNTKEPTTYEEQVQILKNRGLLFYDEISAKDKLSQINYYTFSGYLFHYKTVNEHYNGIYFEDVFGMYSCDRRFKALVLYAIEIIEQNLKTKLAYTTAHLLSPLWYLEVNNFKSRAEHQEFLKRFNRTVRKNQKLQFVKHHIDNYNGKFPIWVAVELFTLGMLRNVYSNSSTHLQKAIAKELNISVVCLDSWLADITYIRNMAAHNMRLYKFNKQKTPKKCSLFYDGYIASNKIFDTVYIMKFLIQDIKEWNDYILPEFAKIFRTYNKYIDIASYGFPIDWYEKLKI